MQRRHIENGNRRKAYAIIHDDNNILIGTGGHSGHPPIQRRGHHLPGGTVGQNEEPLNAVIRETGEETGFVLELDGFEEIFDYQSGRTKVFFYRFPVNNVEAIINERQPIAVRPINDEPFENLLALPLVGCANNPNFNVEFQTDWFIIGLSHLLRERIL